MTNIVNKSKKCFGCYDPIENDFYHEKCALNLFGQKNTPLLETTNKEIENIAKSFIDKRFTVTGVQRKLSLHLDEKTSDRFTIVGTLGGGYIMKPQSPKYRQMPEIEDLTMHLAKICNIKTAAHGLLQMKDGSVAYVTKRFDRKGKVKIAVEDLCQLSELPTEKKYRASHEKAGKIIRQYSNIPGDDILRFFELIVFSYLTGNNDMHLKNFSLFTDETMKRVLTPSYDLLAVRLILSAKEDPEELALTLNGKKNRLKKEDFLAFAENIKIPTKVAKNLIVNQCSQKSKMKTLIDKSFLSEIKKEEFTDLIIQRMDCFSAIDR